MLQQLDQSPSLLLRQRIGLQRRRKAQPPGHHRRHAVGHQTTQQLFHIPVGTFADIPQDASLQLLLIQRRLQVDAEPVLLFSPVPQMGAGRQYQRAGHAEVGKQHLTEFPEYRLIFAVIHRQLHVFQAQSLHMAAAVVIADQRHQRAPRLHDGMAQCGGNPIAVAGGSGAGIGHAAGGDDHRVGGVGFLLPCHRRHAAVRRLHRRGTVMEPADTQRLDLPLQCVRNVKGAVGHRKHPVAPLHLQRHTAALEKRHGIPAGKVGQCAVKESAITGNVSHQALQIRVVGDVAAALSRDIDLLTQPLVRLYQAHLRTVLCGGDGGHQTGGSAADHRYLIHLPLFQKYCILTTPAPCRRTPAPPRPASAGLPPGSAR